MFGYLGTFNKLDGIASPEGSNNFGLLSTSPHVRNDYLARQEKYYSSQEEAGKKPQKITGRYKHVAGTVQSLLQELLGNRESLQRLKEEGGGFPGNHLVNYFLKTQIVDERDYANPLEDPWFINVSELGDEAQKVIDWVRKTADGPVSVI